MPSAQPQTPPRKVRLTFDDGPGATTTPRLLDQLKQFGIKATFFVVGRNFAGEPGSSIIKRMAAEGHQIGNHSYSHPRFTELNPAQIEQEIKKTEDLIGPLDNGIKLFRPPFGFHNDDVDRMVETLGYQSVFWNVSSLDWREHYQNRRWVSHVLKQIESHDDCTVLAHDVFPTTVEHVPELIETIRELPGTMFAKIEY